MLSSCDDFMMPFGRLMFPLQFSLFRNTPRSPTANHRKTTSLHDGHPSTLPASHSQDRPRYGRTKASKINVIHVRETWQAFGFHGKWDETGVVSNSRCHRCDATTV